MSTPMGLGEDEIEALDAFEESLCRWVEQAVQSEVERVVLSLNRHEAWAVPEIPDVVVDGKGWDGASRHFADGYREMLKSNCKSVKKAGS
jgi:hypothetical protein